VLIKGGKSLFGRDTWFLAARRTQEKTLLTALAPSASEYKIQASRDGAEEFYATKLPAGQYYFARLYQTGFSTFQTQINIQFTVEPGKTMYIGRVVVEFPSGVLTVGTPFQLRIEDDRVAAIDNAKRRFGLAGDSIGTALGTIGLSLSY